MGLGPWGPGRATAGWPPVHHVSPRRGEGARALKQGAIPGAALAESCGSHPRPGRTAPHSSEGGAGGVQVSGSRLTKVSAARLPGPCAVPPPSPQERTPRPGDGLEPAARPGERSPPGGAAGGGACARGGAR